MPSNQPALTPLFQPRAPVLPIHCHFTDLVDARITKNWPHLLRLIEKEGFPPGVMLSRNKRAWPVELVLAWLAARPTAKKIVAPRKVVTPRKQKQTEPKAAA